MTTTCVFPADVGVERFTFGFTVRDSHDFFINVTAWGNEAYIIGLSSNFSIEHCGEEVIAWGPKMIVKIEHGILN